MAIVGNLTIGLSVATDKLTKGFKDAKDQVAGFGDKLSGIATKFAPLIAGVAAVGGVALGIKSAMDRIDDLGASADKIGVSVEALQKLQFAAGQSDVELATLQGGLQKLTINLGQAVNGSDKAADAFKALGLDANALANMGTTEAFAAIAQKVSEIKNPTEQAAAAVSIFGKSGAELLPLLKVGGEGIDELAARAEELGLVMNKDQVAGIKEANDAIGELGLAWEGVFNNMAAIVAPVITFVFKSITWLVTNIRKAVMFIYDAFASVFKGVVQVVVDSYNAIAETLGMSTISNPFESIGQDIAADADVMAGSVEGFSLAAKQADKDADALAKKLEAVQKKAQDLNKEWQTQIETQGMSSREIEIYKLKAEGATQEQIAALELLNNKLNETEAAAKRASELKEIDDLAGAWQKQADTIGLAGRELEIYNAKAAGATDEQIAKLTELNNKLKEQEQAAAMKAEGEALKKELMTPLEQYQEKVAKLQELLSKGAIDQETFARGMAKANEGLPQDNSNKDTGNRLSGVASFGSVDAFSTLARASSLGGNDPMQNLNKTNEQQLTQLKELVSIARKGNQTETFSLN